MVALFVASHAMAVWSMFHTCEVWWSSSRTPAVRGWTPDATHFMFIDADIGFATGQIAAMLGFDEDRLRRLSVEGVPEVASGRR